MGNNGPKLAQNCPHQQRIRLPGSTLHRDKCTDESLPKGLTRRNWFTATLQRIQSTSGGTNP